MAEELRPNAAAWERDRWFPDDVFLTLGRRGYLGLKYPREYGGGGGDHVLDAVLTEELGRCGSGGLAAALGAHTGIATPPVWKFGTEDQRRRFLAPAIRGERVAALGITEPGAGSDVAGIRTRARSVEGGYRVSGSKTFITNGVRADFVVTAVKTTDEGGHHGLSFLLIERGAEGFTVSRRLEKLGWHASDTAELAFDDVFVPEDNRLGDENRGFYLIMANFQWERLLMALGAIGGMEACLERVLSRDGAPGAGGGESGAGGGESGAGGGESGAGGGGSGAGGGESGARDGNGQGRPGHGQAARHAVAESAIRLEAARAITYHALRLFARGENAVREVTMAKLATQRAAYEVSESALRLRSALPGVTDGELAELDRAARDTRLGPIGGGTDEIMSEILGRQLGL